MAITPRAVRSPVPAPAIAREQGVGSSNLPAPTNNFNSLMFLNLVSAPDIVPET